MILDMLKEGKITVEQASDLLEAVGKDKSKNNEESFVDKLWKRQVKLFQILILILILIA